MRPRPLNTDSPRLLALLAAVVALGPLTIDMYLPAMPGMAAILQASTSQVQLTISSYLLGFSLFHLVCGPLADRYGRRPILLGGLGLYLVASLACARASSIDELILLRFLQGAAACVGPTLGRAIARDLYGPHRAARALAYIAMIMALAPAVAPTLGGFMLEFYSWSSIFVALTVYALIVMGCIAVWLPESLPQAQALHPVQIGRNYLQLLQNSHFMTITLASALVYAGMIAFLSGSSFIFIDMMGVPARYFGTLFLATVIGYVAGNALSTRLSRDRDSEQVMWIGARIAALAGLLMLCATEVWFHPVSILLPMAGFSMALGIVLPHSMAAALRPFPHMAGTASALFGFIQMAVSSAGGALVGIYLTDSARPMILVIFGLSTVSCWLIRRLQPS